MKTNRRDALQLARLLRAGELTAVWVPDEAHEAMRDLIRSRQMAVDDMRPKLQPISSMMLRQGRTYPACISPRSVAPLFPEPLRRSLDAECFELRWKSCVSRGPGSRSRT